MRNDHRSPGGETDRIRGSRIFGGRCSQSAPAQKSRLDPDGTPGKAPLPKRTIETILAEWRAAEARLGDDLTDDDLAALINALRAEHAAAVEARRGQARELGRAPGALETLS